jgi:hypothetical protein
MSRVQFTNLTSVRLFDDVDLAIIKVDVIPGHELNFVFVAPYARGVRLLT